MSYSWDKPGSPVFSGVLRRRRQRQWVAILVVLTLVILVGLSLIGRKSGDTPTSQESARPTVSAMTPPQSEKARGPEASSDPTGDGQRQTTPGSSSGGADTSAQASSADLIREPVLEGAAPRQSPDAAANLGGHQRSDSSAKPAVSATPDPSVQAATEVRQTLQAWADAWSRRDFDAYQAAYIPTFKGNQASRQEWLVQRRARIVPRTRIQVVLTDVVIGVEGNRARVDFRQLYASDNWSDDTQRTIEMLKTPQGWRIAGESNR